MVSKRLKSKDPDLVYNQKGYAWNKFKSSWQLQLMLVLPLLYIIIFHYGPMYGIQIAWRNYRARDGIWGSAWVGWKNFQEFFAYYKWKTLVKNTLAISFYQLLAGFPIPIILALFLHVSNHKVLVKITQNISYIPHFISTVIMVGILNQVFNPITGFYGHIMKVLRQHKIISSNNYYDILSSEGAFRHLYVWSGIWQAMGWGTILYIAALAAVSPELHEAATIDGASRWKRVLHVDIPTILPTISIMFILRSGHIMSVGYEKVYLMQNKLNIDKSEVISTYVYKYGLAKNKLSYGSAIGLMNSAINSVMIILVNFIANKLSDGEAGLF